MCCKASLDGRLVGLLLLLLLSVQVLEAQPQSCINALNEADVNNDSIINETEYIGLMIKLSPYLGCPDTEDFTVFSGLSLAFQGLSCLCQHFGSDLNCCSGADIGLSVPGVYSANYTSRLCEKLNDTLVMECGDQPFAPTPVPTSLIRPASDAPSTAPSDAPAFFDIETRSLPNDDGDKNLAKIVTPIVVGFIVLLFAVLLLINYHRMEGGFVRTVSAHTKGALKDDLKSHEPTEESTDTHDADFSMPTRSVPTSNDLPEENECDIEANIPKSDDLENSGETEEPRDSNEASTPNRGDLENDLPKQEVESVQDDKLKTPETGDMPQEETKQISDAQFTTPDMSVTRSEEQLEQVSNAQIVTPDRGVLHEDAKFRTPTLRDLQQMSEPTEETVISEDHIDTPVIRNYRVSDPIKDLEDILGVQENRDTDDVFRTPVPAQESLEQDSEIQFSTLAMGALNIDLRNSEFTSESEDSFHDISPFDTPPRGVNS